MRITGGTYRGKILKSPQDNRVRPTADKTRLAVFNMLDSRRLVVGAQVADVFCGTGALGLDAISRGATSAVFVDAAPDSLALARDNATAMGVLPATRFVQAQAPDLPVAPSGVMDLVFLDPPYRQGLVETTLATLLQKGWLHTGSVIVAEMEKEHTPLWPSGIAPLVQKAYGGTVIYLLEVSS